MLLAAVLALMAPGTAAAERAVEGRLLVTWDGGVGKPDRARARAAVAGERLVRTDRALGLQVLRVAPGQAAAVARRLRAERGVRTVERDVLRTPSHVDCQGNPVCVLPGDPLFGAQWGLQNDGGTSHRSPGARAGADIAAPLAWAQSKGAATRIAIIDTGIDEGHEDLAGRVVAGWAAGGGSDRSDGVGHGTHVAGIAAAIPGNGRGGAGVAWSGTLINLKANVGADTSFPCSAISTAVRQAADLGAKVINMSLGGPTPCSAEQTAIAYAQARDVLVVAAAGNEGSTTVQYPAGLRGRDRGGRDDERGRARAVLQPGRELGRHRGARRRHPLDGAREPVRLPERHVDGGAVRVGRGGADLVERARRQRQRPHRRGGRGAAAHERRPGDRLGDAVGERPAQRVPRARRQRRPLPAVGRAVLAGARTQPGTGLAGPGAVRDAAARQGQGAVARPERAERALRPRVAGAARGARDVQGHGAQLEPLHRELADDPLPLPRPGRGAAAREGQAAHEGRRRAPAALTRAGRRRAGRGDVRPGAAPGRARRRTTGGGTGPRRAA